MPDPYMFMWALGPLTVSVDLNLLRGKSDDSGGASSFGASSGARSRSRLSI